MADKNKPALARDTSFLGGKRHTISPQEKRSFVEHVNRVLKDVSDLKGILPIDPNSNEIFHAVKSGILLAHLVNKTVPGSIDMSKIETKKLDIARGGKFNVINNHNLTLDALRNVGCKVINVSAEDLISGQELLVMGLLWQVVQKGLSLNMQEAMSSNLKDETKNMSEKEILLYWMNKLLKEGGYRKTVGNFTSDIADGEAYAILLEQLCPDYISAKEVKKKDDPLERATMVLECAEKVDAKKFVQPEDIVSGNGNLNYAFVANLFHQFADAERKPKKGDDDSSSSSSDSESSSESEDEKVEKTPKETPAIPVESQSARERSEQRIRELEEIIHELQTKLGESEENFKKFESDLLKRVKELEAENKKLKEELEAERRRKEKEEENKKKDLLASENEKDLRLAEQERELSKLREDHEKLTKKLRDSEKESKGRGDELDEMTKKVRELEDREAEREKTARKKLKEENDREEELEKLRKRCAALENENNRLEQTLEEMDDELKEIKAREWVRKKAEVEKTDSYLKLRYESLKNDVVIEGYLVKLANHGNKWKKRYFVLRDHYLFYFQSKESDKKGAKFIRLRKAQIIDKGVDGKRQQVIVIKPKTGDRAYKIDFDSAKHKEKWLEKLLHAAGTQLLDAASVLDEKKEKRKSWFGRQFEKKPLKEQRKQSEPAISRKGSTVGAEGKQSPSPAIKRSETKRKASGDEGVKAEEPKKEPKKEEKKEKNEKKGGKQKEEEKKKEESSEEESSSSEEESEESTSTSEEESEESSEEEKDKKKKKN